MLKYLGVIDLGLISGLVIAGTINFASTAIAETGTVTFSGTILPQASFSDPTFGKAEPVYTLGSSNPSNELQSINTTKISIETHKPINVSISSPVDTQDNITLRFGSKSIMSNGDSVSLPSGNTDLEMNMSLDKSEALAPSNDRTYSVTITLTP